MSNQAQGRRLRKLRGEKNLTAKELAAICSVTPGRVSQWEDGDWSDEIAANVIGRVEMLPVMPPADPQTRAERAQAIGLVAEAARHLHALMTVTDFRVKRNDDEAPYWRALKRRLDPAWNQMAAIATTTTLKYRALDGDKR